MTTPHVPTVETRITPRRRCGLRKPGGLYLVAAGPAQFCGRLPIELSVCPCCGRGIKPARSWTWVDATAILATRICAQVTTNGDCPACPLGKPIGRAGLLWVGSCYYPSALSWTEEARLMGVSRRIPAVPAGFVLGQTWVLMAHRQAITRFEDDSGRDRIVQLPGIFHAFKPAAIEYVVRGDESELDLANLRARTITPVKDFLPTTREMNLAANTPHESGTSTA